MTLVSSEIPEITTLASEHPHTNFDLSASPGCHHRVRFKKVLLYSPESQGDSLPTRHPHCKCRGSK